MASPRFSDTQHIPGAPAELERGGPSPSSALEVRQLLQWAVTERSRSITRGWSKVNPAYVNSLMAPLFDWLRCNPYPSTSTLRRLHTKHWAAIRVVMPGNAAGRKRLDRLENLLLGA